MNEWLKALIFIWAALGTGYTITWLLHVGWRAMCRLYTSRRRSPSCSPQVCSPQVCSPQVPQVQVEAVDAAPVGQEPLEITADEKRDLAAFAQSLGYLAPGDQQAAVRIGGHVASFAWDCARFIHGRGGIEQPGEVAEAALAVALKSFSTLQARHRRQAEAAGKAHGADGLGAAP